MSIENKTTAELAELLGFEVDALTLKPFADTGVPSVGKEILFSGYEIYTHSELVDIYNENMRVLEMAYKEEASQV